MEVQEVKKILESSNKAIIILALQLVNLKNKEINSIELIHFKGYTIQETAEIMNCSINSIKNYKSKAYKKIAEVWGNIDILKNL